MKVLIIVISRSGSTTLTEMLSELLDYKSFHEPFNYISPKLINLNKDFPRVICDNSVVKTIVTQFPNKVNNSIDFLLGYSCGFDKVILLSRKNKQHVYESLLHNYIKNLNGNWHEEYFYKNLSESTEVRSIVEKQYMYINKLSKLLHIPITWYENLYSNDKYLIDIEIKKWDIESIQYENAIKYIDTKFKLRKNQKINLI